MRKQLLTYLVFLLLAINARAQQTTTVTVGTGTAVSADYGPIYLSDLSGGHTSQHSVIYLASEINATPFAGRVLTKLAWNKTDSTRYAKSNGNLKIYVKQTTAATIPSSFFGDILMSDELVGATLVYSSTTQNISAGAGWKSFTLNKPFLWDGTSNLKVIIDWSMPGVTTGTAPMYWNTTPVTTDVSAYFFDAFQLGYIYIQPNRPNIQMTFTEYSNEAGISAITAPAAIIAPGSNAVQATIKNTGNNAITSATIGWQVNGAAQANYSWTGNLASGATSAPITLGSFPFAFGSSTIKAYTKNPNGTPDPLTYNDSASFKLIACTALSGNYTINKGASASATNFQSFTDAAQALYACGINGAVTFTVAPNSGPYNETLSLKNVSGVSATNTITFEGNGNTLAANLATATSAAVTIDNVKYFKLNNLIVTATTAFTSGYGIQLMNQSHYTTISNCTVNVPSGYQSLIGLVIGGTNNASGDHSSNSLFQNNTINGGGYGMRINGKFVTGSTPIGAVNVRVIGNNFRDFSDHGMYVSYSDGLKIEGNDFSRPAFAGYGSFTGIDLSSGCINTLINKNRIHNTHGAADKTSGLTGITIQDVAPAGSENIVKNNLFYDLNNAANITVLNTSSTTDGAFFYNNTISIENPNRPATNSNTIKAFNLGGPGANIKFVNNVVTINTPGTGNKAAIFYQNFNSSTDPIAATFKSNNNVFYIAPGQTNAYVAYLATPTPITTSATLAAWQAINTITPYDMNSVEANPAYVSLSTGNLKPTAPGVNNKGQALAAVTDDILGVTRNATTPDAGAYEFDLGTNDAGITAFVSPATPATPGVSTPVTVTLKNMGTANLNNVTIGWKVDGAAQPSYSWTGTVASNATTPVTIGNFTFANGAHTICAWTKNPNGGTDANSANDSTCAAINACAALAGNYTINKGAAASATNFTSFTAATAALHNCGVSAKVTITVAPASGPYTEQVNLLSIPGTSATNRVIFQGNGNTLTAAPNSQKAAVLLLDNADYVKINNLAVALTGTITTSTPPLSAIQLVNNSDNDTISNCTINMSPTVGTSIYVLGIYAGIPQTVSGSVIVDGAGNFTNNSVFMNNTINGGHTGIVINGNTGGTNAVNNRVTGNVITDVYSAGIVMTNVDGAIVEQNEIKRPTFSSPNGGAVFGITLGGDSKNTKISKNRIHDLWSSTASGSIYKCTTYGINATGAGAPVGSENIVSNNLIYDTNSTEAYGIANQPGGVSSATAHSGIYYYNNTIDISNKGKAVGYYQNQIATNVKFINNIVTINAPGSGDKFILLWNNANAIESNNNVFFIDPSNINIIVASHTFAGVTTMYNTLGAWQASNGAVFDMQSKYGNPNYKNPATGDYTPQNYLINNVGKPLAAVTTDITGAPRSTTPDPGAYEFNAAAPTGVKDELLAKQLTVFPNPSNGQFNVSLPAGNTYELIVTDLTGKVIKHQQANGNAQLNLEGTAKGIYLLKVSSESGSAVRKLIVE